MTIDIDYALMSANSYAVKSAVTSDENTIPIPSGWRRQSKTVRKKSLTGFTARAYQNTTTDEIAIAYTGTTFESYGNDIGDWLAGNISAGAGALGLQSIDAAEFYLDIIKDHPTADISFTGHSLGGGLASLMAVYFNRKATVFDVAPFKKSADSLAAFLGLKLKLLADGYALPPAFSDLHRPGSPARHHNPQPNPRCPRKQRQCHLPHGRNPLIGADAHRPYCYYR